MEDRKCLTCKYSEVPVLQEPCLTCYSSDDLVRYPCWVPVKTIRHESAEEFAKRKYGNSWPTSFDLYYKADILKFAEEYANERITK